VLNPRSVRCVTVVALVLATIAVSPRAVPAGIWPSALTPQAAKPEAAQKPHPAVVRVIAPEEGGTSFGSGTLVDVRGDYGLVLTNWHVVADATHTIEVLFPDGFRTAARVITTDRTWDLAALAVWRPTVEPVRMASQPPKPGDLLTIAGYGSGKYRAVTGKCTQYVAPALNRPYEMVELSVAARQGDSGGPIFNSQGELAGVLWGAGWGTTAGSYCGRVASFVASIMPPPGVGEERAVSQIAQAPPAAAGALVPVEYNAPVAQTNRPDKVVADQHWTAAHASIAKPAGGRSKVASSPAGAVEQEAPAELDANAGGDQPSALEQIELFLAFVGGAALLLHGLRFLMPAK
jgi:hypothetical protein